MPHGSLQRVPFHAMFDGGRYVIERFEVSYAPSATVYALCQERETRDQGRAVVFGVENPLTLAATAEARTVAGYLPGAEVLVGDNATIENLRNSAPKCGTLHLACHGLFRSDNPMFSALKLHDGWLIAADAMSLELSGSLVTLKQAEERVCRGTIGAATVDNLRVPSSATCTLNGTQVKGSIKVERGARLFANGVSVVGNIQSEGFQTASVKEGSTVGGSVQLENGQRDGLARIASTRINGDLQFFSNRARMATKGNTILATLQAVSNTGGLVIQNNRISENLQCRQNSPPPTGDGNVAGDKEDQCARL